MSLFLSISVFAADDVVKAKLELVKQVKTLFSQNIDFYPPQLEEQTSLFQLLNPFKEAYAASYACLYGGWPSDVITYRGKKYCHDAKKSGYYKHSYACSDNQFTCPPVLFGEEKCVSYSTRSQRISVFANCSKISGEPHITSSLTDDNNKQIVEYMQIAQDICESKRKNVVKVNCDKVAVAIKNYQNVFNSRRPSGIDGPNNSDDGNDNSTTNGDAGGNVEPTKKPTDCVNCSASNDPAPIVDVTPPLSSEELVYNTLKDNFRKSPLCDPSSNYKENDQKVHAIAAVDNMLYYCSAFALNQPGRLELCQQYLENIANEFDPNLKNEWVADLNQLYQTKNNDLHFKLMAKVKQYVLRANNTTANKRLAKNLYYYNKVLVEEDGEITCPFPSKDAVFKALKGYNKLKGKLKNNKLTIVDYTMPSVQRRMFVIDMDNLQVMHNTWTAHGMGMNGGADKNTVFSNVEGSQLSSDGFMLTQGAAHGSMYGDNILLRGIDRNNKNVARRAIVLHGDSVVGGGYKAFNFSSDNADEKMSLLENLDLNNTSDMYSYRKASGAPGNYYKDISKTYGCLGVPDYPALNTKTGKRESQLQMLRQDISNGSLIFSYSGAEQESDYF